MHAKAHVKDLILIGFGSVHQHLARILLDKGKDLAARHGLDLRVVGVADSGGATYQRAGLDLAALLAHKQAGNSVCTFPTSDPVSDALVLARTTDYDFLLEASPVNLDDGEPAMSCVRAALERGRSVVLANKAPLVLDYVGLHELAHNAGARASLAFSATVCGGLPVINVGQRDLVGATIHKIEGIFNSTSNYILSRMAAGESYETALAEAQRRGLAETDPTLDVEGWDTANKLVIIANAVLGIPAKLADVSVEGITEVGEVQLAEAKEAGRVIKLVATAEWTGTGYTLRVKSRQLPASSFLGGVSDWQMGIIFHTDIYEEISMKVDERDPTATGCGNAARCGKLEQSLIVKHNLGDKMIVRMWHGRVPTSKAQAYRVFLNERAIPDYQSVEGNINVYILERKEGEITHFITMTFWESLDVIKGFAGEDAELAKYYPEDKDFLLEFEAQVVHYEIVGQS